MFIHAGRRLLEAPNASAVEEPPYVKRIKGLTHAVSHNNCGLTLGGVLTLLALLAPRLRNCRYVTPFRLSSQQCIHIYIQKERWTNRWIHTHT